jgi:hypothetical protein
VLRQVRHGVERPCHASGFAAPTWDATKIAALPSEASMKSEPPVHAPI